MRHRIRISLLKFKPAKEYRCCSPPSFPPVFGAPFLLRDALMRAALAVTGQEGAPKLWVLRRRRVVAHETAHGHAPASCLSSAFAS
jgi:hypothetical protein